MLIDISYILTVYNKEKYLKNTLASLRSQTGEFKKEFIFVDDCSTDNSLHLIEQETRSWKNVTIIRNEQNKGPSVRLNQGVTQAAGKYVYLLDSDDILPTNSAARMLDILEKEKADIIYGKFQKTTDPVSCLDKSIPPNLSYTVSENPLEYIMRGGFVRMGQLTTKDLYIKCGGCDERIFIQDESLPIRLCATAQKFIDYNGIVLFMPIAESEKLSSNELQLQHDAFWAYYFALKDIRHLKDTIRKELQLKIVSTLWKSARKTKKLPYLSIYFGDYIRSKLLKTSSQNSLDRAREFYKSLPNIRRMQEHLLQ